MTHRHKFMLNVFSTERQKQVWGYSCSEVPVHFSTSGQAAEAGTSLPLGSRGQLSASIFSCLPYTTQECWSVTVNNQTDSAPDNMMITLEKRLTEMICGNILLSRSSSGASRRGYYDWYEKKHDFRWGPQRRDIFLPVLACFFCTSMLDDNNLLSLTNTYPQLGWAGLKTSILESSGEKWCYCLDWQLTWKRSSLTYMCSEPCRVFTAFLGSK